MCKAFIKYGADPNAYCERKGKNYGSGDFTNVTILWIVENEWMDRMDVGAEASELQQMIQARGGRSKCWDSRRLLNQGLNDTDQGIHPPDQSKQFLFRRRVRKNCGAVSWLEGLFSDKL